jgi:hypothetical protein
MWGKYTYTNIHLTPHCRRPALQDAVNLPIQPLLASRQASCPTNEDEADALPCIVICKNLPCLLVSSPKTLPLLKHLMIASLHEQWLAWDDGAHWY